MDPVVTVRAGQSRRTSGQRGVILFVAMITMLALALATLSIDRAVATDAAIGGNVASQLQAVWQAEDGVERAVDALFVRAAIVDMTRDDPSQHYYASRQPGEDRRGIPRVLQAVPLYPAVLPTLDAGDRHALRYVIERLCRSAGDATRDNCTLSPPVAAAPPGARALWPAPAPYFRVTVRVDAAKGTAFVQATLAPSSASHRVSWRVVDDAF
ncbi:MAG: hypothetical protein ABI533_03770 [Betaproteobacteria bacterium]